MHDFIITLPIVHPHHSKLQLSSYESFKVTHFFIKFTFFSENLLRLVQRFWSPLLLGRSDRDETSWGLPPDMYLGPDMKNIIVGPRSESGIDFYQNSRTRHFYFLSSSATMAANSSIFIVQPNIAYILKLDKQGYTLDMIVDQNGRGKCPNKRSAKQICIFWITL